MESNKLLPRVCSAPDSGTHAFFEFPPSVGVFVSEEDSDDNDYGENES